MKSFVAYPFDLDVLISHPVPDKSSGKLVAHYELFKQVKNLSGAIVKCGISAEEGFTRFAMFRSLVGSKYNQKMVAFQKHLSFFEEEITPGGEVTIRVKTRNAEVSTNKMQEIMIQKAMMENVDFVPGSVNDFIPEYLIENPELKIAMLNIDLDDYDGTTNALEFLYPRIVQGGLLIMDNYFKNMAERKAVEEYFRPNMPSFSSFSVNNGPHYIFKK